VIPILLDSRAGSKELQPYFKPYAIPLEVCHLEYADAAFVGNGPDGPCYIGIERKTIGDLMNSLRSGRLGGHQLGGLIENYDAAYLILEGILKPGNGGELLTSYGNGQWRPAYNGRTVMLYREVDNFLTTMETAGLRVRKTAYITETACVIANLFAWWSKPFEDHKAHREIYAPVPAAMNGRKLRLDVPKPSLVVKVAAQLPGLDQKAWDVGKVFQSVEEMMQAGEKQWKAIPGIGKIGARKIMKAIQGGE